MNSAFRQRLPVDWNRRQLTDLDFDLLCEAEGVHVLESRMRPRGLYLVYDALPIIVVNSRLRGWRRQFVQWHELGHHFLHAPGSRYLLNFETKSEAQADVFAACALIPLPVLHQVSLWELAADFGYDVELCRLRERIWRLWGL